MERETANTPTQSATETLELEAARAKIAELKCYRAA
jgi:hypothetical protein